MVRVGWFRYGCYICSPHPSVTASQMVKSEDKKPSGACTHVLTTIHPSSYLPLHFLHPLFFFVVAYFIFLDCRHCSKSILHNIELNSKYHDFNSFYWCSSLSSLGTLSTRICQYCLLLCAYVEWENSFSLWRLMHSSSNFVFRPEYNDPCQRSSCAKNHLSKCDRPGIFFKEKLL